MAPMAWASWALAILVASFGQAASGVEVRVNSRGPLLVRKVNHARRAAPDDVARFGEKHVAILTSGQAFRFTYKEQFKHVEGGINGLVCGAGRATCGIKADVYVVMAETHGPHWAGKAPQQPPYGHSPVEIEKYYRHKGANHVYVKIVPTREYDGNISHLEQMVVAKGASTMNVGYGDWKHRAEALPKFNQRFRPHSGMFFLRHAVYNAALSGEKTLGYTYSHFLYIREDNLLYKPGYTLAALMIKDAPITLDSRCGFGSWPDRTYFTNREGADLVFTSSHDEFIARMALWVQTALDGNPCAKHGFQGTELKIAGSELTMALQEDADGKPMTMDVSSKKVDYDDYDPRKVDPLQTECFIQAVFNSKNVKVDHLDFHIVPGFRYVRTDDGHIRPCVTHLYGRCSPFVKEAADMCGDQTKIEK